MLILLFGLIGYINSVELEPKRFGKSSLFPPTGVYLRTVSQHNLVAGGRISASAITATGLVTRHLSNGERVAYEVTGEVQERPARNDPDDFDLSLERFGIHTGINLCARARSGWSYLQSCHRW